MWDRTQEPINEILKDIEWSDNPQHDTPLSIKMSAEEEFLRRGYNKQDLAKARLGEFGI